MRSYFRRSVQFGSGLSQGCVAIMLSQEITLCLGLQVHDIGQSSYLLSRVFLEQTTLHMYTQSTVPQDSWGMVPLWYRLITRPLLPHFLVREWLRQTIMPLDPQVKLGPDKLKEFMEVLHNLIDQSSFHSKSNSYREYPPPPPPPPPTHTHTLCSLRVNDFGFPSLQRCMSK